MARAARPGRLHSSRSGDAESVRATDDRLLFLVPFRGHGAGFEPGRRDAQDRNASRDAFVGSLAHESLEIGAEEPDMPAELDPP